MFAAQSNRYVSMLKLQAQEYVSMCKARLLHLPRGTANRPRPIALRVLRSVVTTTHGLARIQIQASRSATKNPVRNPDPMDLQARVQICVVMDAPVVRLSKNVFFIILLIGRGLGQVIGSVAILPAMDRKDRIRVATAQGAAGDPIRVIIHREEDPTRAITPPVVAEDLATVRHQVRVPHQARIVPVRVKIAPHDPVPELHQTAQEKERPIVAKMAVGPAGTMQIMAPSS